jgi:hypothetical protein
LNYLQPFFPVMVFVCFSGPDRSDLLSKVYGMLEFVYFYHCPCLHVLVSYLCAGMFRYCLVESAGMSADVLLIVFW